MLLLREDGLLYAGTINPITPPDLYGLVIDGERGTKGQDNILCAEEVLTQAVSSHHSKFIAHHSPVMANHSALYSNSFFGRFLLKSTLLLVVVQSVQLVQSVY